MKYFDSGDGRCVIARVFPRRTRATPTDGLAFVGDPPLFLPENISRVHISVLFTYDLAEAERLARSWRHVAPVEIGGPAIGQPGGDFVPGLYVKPGYVITSRGCPNRCWFCSVWKRENGVVTELPIMEGWNVLDDNLLACSDAHIRAVFTMLRRQKRKADFSGGLEAARLKPWHADELAELRPAQVWLAYDEARDREPFLDATRMLQRRIEKKGHWLRSYVLIGYPGDTMDAAKERLEECFSVGVLPQAMLYRNATGHRDPEWQRFQREYARAFLTASHMLETTKPEPRIEPILAQKTLELEVA